MLNKQLQKGTWKISQLNWVWNHALCNTGAVLLPLSYQASWELVTLRVCSNVEDDMKFNKCYSYIMYSIL